LLEVASLGDAISAEDDEPVIDPMQTKGRAPGARVSMDAAATKGLFQRFPDLARIGRA
jgi:environmental stress-induced protein Ves